MNDGWIQEERMVLFQADECTIKPAHNFTSEISFYILLLKNQFTHYYSKQNLFIFLCKIMKTETLLLFLPGAVYSNIHRNIHFK